MARVIEFDPEEAIEKAMRLFWRKGYDKTSIRDLVAETGVAHAGLYNVFGDKLQLFKAALDLYSKTIVSALLEDLEKPDASRPEIEEFFARLMLIVKTKGFQDGCLMCNAAIEFGKEKGEILDKVDRHIERIINAFSEALTRAKARKEVSPDFDPKAGAEYFTCIFNGLASLVRSKTDPARLERIVKLALQTLG